MCTSFAVQAHLPLSTHAHTPPRNLLPSSPFHFPIWPDFYLCEVNGTWSRQLPGSMRSEGRLEQAGRQVMLEGIPVEGWDQAPGLFLMEMDKCNLAQCESAHGARWGRVLAVSGKGSLGTLQFLSTGPGALLVKVEVIWYCPADHPGVKVSSTTISIYSLCKRFFCIHE